MEGETPLDDNGRDLVQGTLADPVQTADGVPADSFRQRSITADGSTPGSQSDAGARWSALLQLNVTDCEYFPSMPEHDSRAKQDQRSYEEVMSPCNRWYPYFTSL